jgi:RHS repeat-associated protein
LRSLIRDNAERIIGYTHTNKGTPVAALNQTFGYDNLNRLTSGTIGATGTSYSYDATGNRTSKTIGGTTYANTVDATSNKFTQTQDVGGTTNVQYDAAGHMTSDGTNTYTYNDRGRMNTATVLSGAVSFLYNGLNQRVSKSGTAVAGGSVYYFYDEAGQLLGEYDSTGAPVYETIYLGSTPVGVMKQAGAVGTSNMAVTLYNIDADQIDTPRMITKQDHAIVWRWDTAEAFGATAPNQDPSGIGAFVFNQRFSGQIADVETGLLQNVNREYNAPWGRYIQSDPIGLKGGINTYQYANSQPTSVSDPSGLFTTLNHVTITYIALRECGFNPWRGLQLAWAAAAGDWTPTWKTSQGVENANWHAMAQPGQSVADALAATETFINQQMGMGTTQSMGRAMHAAQDAAARGHKGYQTYTGHSDFSHVEGDELPTTTEIAEAIRRTKNLFPECGCK